jgi:hypothetical protein
VQHAHRRALEEPEELDDRLPLIARIDAELMLDEHAIELVGHFGGVDRAIGFTIAPGGDHTFRRWP